MKRTYKINGKYYKQTEATLNQYEAAQNILGKESPLVQPKADPQIIGEAIEKLFDEGKLRKLFGIILQPDNSSLWKWIKNLFTVGESPFVIDGMTAQQVGQVALDFYLINIGWNTKLLALSENLDLSVLIEMQKNINEALESMSKRIAVIGKVNG
jgi:hypothetical protein